MKLRNIINLIESEQTKKPATDLMNNNAFMNWLYKFEQHKIDYVSSDYKLLKNEYNVVNPSKTYTLYRGLFIKKLLKNKQSQYQVGKTISDSSESWSTSKATACSFALNWNDTGFGTKSKWIDDQSIGIIVQHSFNHDDVLFDLEYMQKQGFKIQFPKEKEIIVNDNVKNVKIIHIITSSRNGFRLLQSFE